MSARAARAPLTGLTIGGLARDPLWYGMGARCCRHYRLDRCRLAPRDPALLAGRNAERGDDLRRTTPARTALTTPRGRGVISELDIYRAANLLIDRHGSDAMIAAARMIDRMLELGDPEGRLIWKRIKRAIGELQAAPSGPAH